MGIVTSSASPSPLAEADRLGWKARLHLPKRRRASMGQFLTPAPVARLMASMLCLRRKDLVVLDPGAGVGSLTAALVERVCSLNERPASLRVVAYEIEPVLAGYLEQTMRACQEACAQADIAFKADIRHQDFIEAGALMVGGDLFGSADLIKVHCIITNPPYKKIRSDSRARKQLRTVGIEAVNLYAAFLALSIKLLSTNGHLLAITPRSFCNGPYYKPFRRLLLGAMTLRRLHVFERRDEAFSQDGVLQEHLIMHAVKNGGPRRSVVVSSSRNGRGGPVSMRDVDYEEVIDPNDPELFMRLVGDDLDSEVSRQIAGLGHTLPDLRIEVSTGRVVDFRVRAHLRQGPSPGCAPLIYPLHFHEARVKWPRLGSRKPNAIVLCPATADLLVPSGYYVLVKRFSAKEERRRVVAAVWHPTDADCEVVGFENHLNYYHRNGAGLPPELAMGLALFLNSTVVDRFFRTFSGHTQVNATDLRQLRYPSAARLSALGAETRTHPTGQDEVDRVVQKHLFA